VPLVRRLDPWVAAPVLLAAVIRIVPAVFGSSTYWGDEVYQVLEPGHRIVFGDGYVAWEYVRGARSWFLPGVVAGLFRGMDLIGIHDPGNRISVVRGLFAVLSVASVYAAYRLARAWGASRPSASFGAMVLAVVVPSAVVGSHTLTEVPAATLVAFGALLTLTGEGRARRLVGASLLGMSILVRLLSALAPIGVVLLLLARRQYRQAAEVTGVLLVWTFLFGLLDRLTWGAWFESARVYVPFNIEHGAEFGRSGTLALFKWFGTGTGGLLALTILVLLVLGAKRGAGLAAIAALTLVALSASPHKELRFIEPVMPLLAAVTALGFEEMRRRLTRRPAAPGRRLTRRLAAPGLLVIAALVVVALGMRLPNMQFESIGTAGKVRGDTEVWDWADAQNKLLAKAHYLPDLCGIAVDDMGAVWVFGYAALARHVPLYLDAGPVPPPGAVNYRISIQPRPGAVVVARSGGVSLSKEAETCTPDPRYHPGWVPRFDHR
jgi:phosphatidylinositol glycan class B